MVHAGRTWRLVGGWLLVGVALAGASCTGGAKKGAAVGGVVGGVAGAVIGNQGDKTGTGAVIGATVGAATGAIIGDYMARQKQELEQVEGAQVVQVGDELQVQFQSAILFDIDSSQLKPSAKDNIQQMAAVLVKYPDTNLLVIGHTDSTGSDAHNQTLSEQRALSVKDYLVTYGVQPGRLQSRGDGETRPVAGNDTAEGRTQNRRVEIQIAANEALKEKAAAEGGQP
jgi:outer membrane protein OmpA-like peptidoglycan-associated protein